MTRSTGVGRGGKRAGAGRKAPPSDTPDNQTDVRALSALELLELAAKALAAAHIWDKASQAAKRLADAQRQAGAPAGKKQQAHATAQAATAPGGRFAPPAPPKH